MPFSFRQLHHFRLRIRLARLPADAAVAQRLAQTLLPYGDYREPLLEWMAYPSVKSYLADLSPQEAGVGLYLLGVFRDEERRCQFSDLLALAVDPAVQRQGVGRALLRHAIAESQATPGLAELRLSVSEHNRAARALFEAEGFTPRPYELGTYRNGALALRLAFSL